MTSNRVNGQILAGLIYLFPEFFGGANGFINYIDYGTGEFRVGGKIGDKNTGQRARINDPVGRYGKPYTTWPLMASDPDSPSIKASTVSTMIALHSRFIRIQLSESDIQLHFILGFSCVYSQE